MGKKQFIKKSEGQTYHVVHRSQTDSAYANEEKPSDYVLVPVQLSNNDNRRKLKDNHSVYSNNAIDFKQFTRKGDHINHLGFKNDGYDYSRHIKEVDGGKFVGLNGELLERPVVKEIEIPEDLLPSAEEFDRNLEAIVISDKYMDEDIRNALDFDGDEDGEFEELDDDFVIQAMAEPEVPDFDFDAHIARLIANSEKDIGYVPARVHFTDDEEDDDDFLEDEEGNESSSQDNQKVSDIQQAIIDEQFEKMLEEYEDDDEDDEDEEGMIDINENAEYLDDALNEFIENQKLEKEYDGLVRQHPMERLSRQTINKDDEDQNIDIKQLQKNSLIEAEKLQNEASIIISEVIEGISKPADPWETVEYLKTVKTKNEWDCETILTTYSTLDNHPSVIKDEFSKFRPHKSRYVVANELANENRQKTLDKTEKLLFTEKKYNVIPNHNTITTKILLSNKTMLPIGFGPHEKNNKSINVLDKHINKESTENTSDNDSNDSEEDGVSITSTTISTIRNKSESIDEKKLRKQKAKELKREKRTIKKNLKLAYKFEEIKLNHHLAKQQDINHARVFKTVA
eukprot:gene16837-22322_t